MAVSGIVIQAVPENPLALQKRQAAQILSVPLKDIEHDHMDRLRCRCGTDFRSPGHPEPFQYRFIIYVSVCADPAHLPI
ncbi:hypothetical protein D3C72_2227170 [compost metagenome]